jgi:leader peptidase (prepilin peptidase) / N-methyltransferase
VPGAATIVLAAALTGLVTAAAVRPVLLALPEPVDQLDKPVYRSLLTTRFLMLCGLLAAVTTAVAWHSVPPATRPLWLVLSSCGVLLAVIDARTTWLPLRLTQAAWLLMLVGAAVGWALGGGWQLLVRAAVGAAVAGALYFIGWLITQGGFGFGDVRYAPLLGAAAAAGSWRLLIWALVLGTVAGGGHGLVRLARRSRGPFPYAPSMLAGVYLAVAASWLWT